MADTSQNRPHWLHSWIPTVIGAVTLLGSVAAGGVAWSNMNHRSESVERSVGLLERTLKSMRPAPTAKEQQCKNVLDALTNQMSSPVGRTLELRQLAAELGCVPKSS